MLDVRHKKHEAHKEHTQSHNKDIRQLFIHLMLNNHIMSPNTHFMYCER